MRKPQRIGITKIIFRLCFLYVLLFSFAARADLQITGVPGFTFSDTAAGRPTVANLNRALRFTYLVSGTIGGTNAGLAAGSVNVTHFASGVGGSNIMVTAGGLVVSNNAIGPNQLSTAAAGAGLGGGGGSALVINCDSNTIINTGDVISVGTGLSNVNVSANAAIAVSKLAWTTNTVVGASTFGTNAPLALAGGLSISGTTLTAFGPQAYAVFKYAGSSTNVTAVRSNNVSWISRDSAGRYTVRFTTALADTNYVASALTDFWAGNSTRIPVVQARSTTQVTLHIETPGGSPSDPDLVNVILW